MRLVIKDGSVIEGLSFGANTERSGELVFTTGMVGYVETLTDPSYKDQIIVFTYPLLGNYGVPEPSDFESKKIHAAGVIVSTTSEAYAHAEAVQGFGAWLEKEGVPALMNVDTRALTKKLRTEGALLAALSTKTRKPDFYDPNQADLVAQVSPTEPVTLGEGSKTVVLIDCGAKENIARSLLARGVRVRRVPYNYDFTDEEFDGVLISNGPGDPKTSRETIALIKKLMKQDRPIFGICLGNQLLAHAAGASTYKLPFGHRSQNQPCTDLTSGRCYITSQNHGFAVDGNKLPKDWQVWFKNANDGSVEGIRHIKKPWYSVQFHPEAHPGPTDCAWLFDHFINSL